MVAGLEQGSQQGSAAGVLKTFSIVRWLAETLNHAPNAHTLGHNSNQNAKGRAHVKTMPLSEVKTKLSELVDAVERRDEVVTITRNGKPIAIIVSKDEYEGWQETVEIMRDEKFMREIRKGIRSLKRTKKRYTLDELFTG